MGAASKKNVSKTGKKFKNVNQFEIQGKAKFGFFDDMWVMGDTLVKFGT